MRIQFDFADLAAFIAIADDASFQLAAGKLGVSQPTLTRRIQKLEVALGVRLFARTTRSTKLTLAGKSFRGRAESMLESAAEAVLALSDEAANVEQQRQAIVTVAAIPTATPRILPQAIRAFRAAGHSARIRLLDADANRVAELVASGEADFGVSFIPTEEPSLMFRPIMNDRFVLAMRDDDPLAAREQVSWSEVDASRLILPIKGTGNRMLIDEALARARQTLQWAYEVGRSTTHLSLVESGVGIAALPELAMPTTPQTHLVARLLVEPVVARAVGTIRRSSVVLTPAAGILYRTLEAALASDVTLS